MNQLLRRLLWPFSCRLGLHEWDEPYHKEYFKSTGFHILFWSSGIQKGARRCKHCPAEQKCFRTGMVGMGGSGEPWKRLSADKERYIDSLPQL